MCVDRQCDIVGRVKKVNDNIQSFLDMAFKTPYRFYK